jgi:hypothetical protein
VSKVIGHREHSFPSIAPCWHGALTEGITLITADAVPAQYQGLVRKV